MSGLLIASLGLEDDVVIDTWMTPETRESLFVVGALVLMVALIMLWVTLFRRSKRRVRHPLHQHLHNTQQHRTAQPVASTPSKAESEHSSGRRGKRRRHRHQPLPQAPSLADTGGLPPKREEQLPPPPPPSPTA